MIDNIPPEIGYPLAIVLWAVWMVIVVRGWRKDKQRKP